MLFQLNWTNKKSVKPTFCFLRLKWKQAHPCTSVWILWENVPFPWLQRTGEDCMRLWEQQKSFPELIPYLETKNLASLSSDRYRTTLTFAWDARFLDDPDMCVSTGRVTLYLEGKTHGEEQPVTGTRYRNQREQHRMQDFRIFFWRLNNCNGKLQLRVVQ